MVGNKTGAIFAVVVLVAVAIGFLLMLNPPTVQAFTPSPTPASGPKYYMNITLYADAQGWDYNHGTVNPTLNILNGTLVQFTVIEEDNQPHTLSFNPGYNESSSGYAYTLLSTSDITSTPGAVSHGSMYFGKLGVYTYWCIIHPTSMVGLIYVNSTSTPTGNNTPPPPTYAHYFNQSFSLTNDAFYSKGIADPILKVQNGTLLNFTASDPGSSTYSLKVSPGIGVNKTNYTTVINTTASSANGSMAFNQTGEYTYWNGNNTTAYGTIYVYVSQMNYTLYADLNGWNYTKASGVNPSLQFSTGALVNFTVVNEDGLTHNLVIGAGSNESSNYSMIATVNSTVSEANGYFLFISAGKYTYWDTYHSTTAVGTITVAPNA